MMNNALAWFRDLLLAIDPEIGKYSGKGTGDYTAWRPLTPIRLIADGKDAECGWRIQVDRFTKRDHDEIAAALYAAFDAADEVAFDYVLDYEQDTGYIHHIFDVEVA